MVILLLTQGFTKIVHTYFADNSTYKESYIKAKDLMIQYPEATCFEILTETQYNFKFMSEKIAIKKEKLIYGFAGRKRSGKTEIADYICKNYGAVKVTIASYLKQLCADLLDCTLDYLNEIKDNGTTFHLKPDNKWIDIINEKTSIPKDLIEKEISNIEFTSVRQMLQVIGTNLIREYNPDWHVNQMINEIKSYPDNVTIVVDDVRFKNEKNAIEQLGGEIYFIIRTSACLNVSNHISEISLTWDDFDDKHILLNDKTLDNVYVKIKNFLMNVSKDYIDDEIKKYNRNYFGKENNDVVAKIVNVIRNDKEFDTAGHIQMNLDFNSFLKIPEEFKIDIDYDINNSKLNITNPYIIENFKKWI